MGRYFKQKLLIMGHEMALAKLYSASNNPKLLDTKKLGKSLEESTAKRLFNKEKV